MYQLQEFTKDNSSAHVLGYVSQASAKDLKNKSYLKEMSVPGMAVGKTGLERRLDKDIIGKVGPKGMKLMHLEKELNKFKSTKVKRERVFKLL